MSDGQNIEMFIQGWEIPFQSSKQPISFHWSLSIPSENISKPLVFWCFKRVYRNKPVAWLRHQNKLCCFTYFLPLVPFRSSHQRCSIQKGVLRNFTKFAGKHQCQSLFFNVVAGLKLYWKRDSGTSVFLWILWNFQKFLFS